MKITGPTPELHWHKNLNGWVGLSGKELWDFLENLRIKTKKAISYFWDNSEFFFDDIFGNPAIKFLLTRNRPKSDEYFFSFWNALKGESLGGFTFTTFSLKNLNDIQEMISHLEKDERFCNAESHWTNDDINHYSFTGLACDEHYNPEIHRPPITT